MAISISLVFSILTFALGVFAASRTSPPSGAKVVRAGTTTSGEYSTVQAAVNALPNDSTTQSIFIYAGTYKEQVYITRAGPTTIYGYTSDTSSYTGNQVTITFSATAGSAGSDDASGTLRVHKNDFALYNVNIKNGYGKGTQAIAYSNQGSRTAAYGCGFYGYQDTLLAPQGLQVYLKSYIEGATDFIFGHTAQAYFGGNTIAVSGPGYITASGRDSDDSGIYLFNSNTVAVASGAASGTSGAYYFGRPWRNYAKVVFKNTQVSGINPALWRVWNTDTPNTEHVTFADYNTVGVTASRPSFATLLTSTQAAAYTISSALGSSYTSWVDTAYVV